MEDFYIPETSVSTNVEAQDWNPLQSSTTSFSDAGTFSNEALMGVIGATFGDSIPSWISGSTQYQALGGTFTDQPKTAEAGQQKEQEEGLLGRIGKWVDKNKTLTELVGRGVQAAAQSAQAERNARASSDAQSQMLREKNAIDQENNARISASVTGLRKPVPTKTSQPLRRADGSTLFKNGRIA